MKRANGTGSVEDLPDGRARIRVRLRSKRTQLGPIFETRDAAEGVLAAWNEGRGDGSIIDASELTLGEYGSTWLDRRELTGSRRRETVRSIDSERSVWTRQVLTSEIAGLAITAVRPRDVDAFSRELRARKAVHAITVGTGSERRTELRPTARPLSRAQQREAMRLVRSVLDEAVRAELLRSEEHV